MSYSLQRRISILLILSFVFTTVFSSIAFGFSTDTAPNLQPQTIEPVIDPISDSNLIQPIIDPIVEPIIEPILNPEDPQPSDEPTQPQPNDEPTEPQPNDAAVHPSTPSIDDLENNLEQNLIDVKQRAEELLTFSEQMIASKGLVIDSKLRSALNSAEKPGDLEVIITYHEYPTEQDILTLTEHGMNLGYKFEVLPMVAVLATRDQLNNFINESSGVRSIYLNEELQYFMKDSRELTGVDRAEKSREYQKWNKGFPVSGKGVTVGVIDSGIDATHPDLEKNTIKNVKIMAGELNTGLGRGLIPPVYVDLPNTDTSSGHGTHVAGTVAGTGVMSNGEHRGVAPGANLIGIGTGEAISILWGLQAFDWALVHQREFDIRVLTNSWGSEFSWDSANPNEPINVATKLSHDRGMVVLFASGNSGGYNTLNPYSIWPWIIGVAAGTKDGNLAGFSSRGLSPDIDSEIEKPENRPTSPVWNYLEENDLSIFDLLHPTVTAPGVDIISTRSKTIGITSLAAEQDANELPPAYTSWYTHMSGTSMATPHMAGVVALLLEANPTLSPEEVKSIVEVTASPMGKYQEFEVGSGYVNVYSALQLAFSMRSDIAIGVDENTFNVSGPDNKSMAYYNPLLLTATGEYESANSEQLYGQTGSYTTGVRDYNELVVNGKAITFNDRVSLIKVRNVDLNNTNDLVVPTGNLFFYRQAGGDEMLSTGGNTNIPYSGEGKLWFNHRGSFSSATGTGGVERSKSYSFDISLIETKINNDRLVQEFTSFGDDQYTLTSLFQSNVLRVDGDYNGNTQATRQYFIDHAYRFLGVPKVVPTSGNSFADVSRNDANFTLVESAKDFGLLTFVKGGKVTVSSTLTNTEVLVSLVTATGKLKEAQSMAAKSEWDIKGAPTPIKKSNIVDKPADGTVEEAAWAYALNKGWISFENKTVEIEYDENGWPIGFIIELELGVNKEITRHQTIKALNGAMEAKYQ